MCKKLVCLVSFIIVLGSAGYVFADEVDVEIPAVGDTKPILDGVMDNVWEIATEQYITITLEGDEPTSEQDCSGSWRALWDFENLYVMVDVNDESLVQDSNPTEGWNDDRIELFIDGDNSKDEETDDKNDYQYNFRWNNGEVETPVEWYTSSSPDSLEGVEYGIATTDYGYLVEIKLPWATMIGGPPQEYQLIGIEVMIDDDDDGGSRDTQLSWYIESGSPHNPSIWGTALIAPYSYEKAGNPDPTNGKTDIPRDVILGWRPGIHAEKHDVYFGTNFEDVNDASRDNDPCNVLVSRNQDDNTYDPNGLLEFEMTYYWRIDEINDVHPNSPWKGNTWSFTTRNYVVVDNFEDYNDYEPDRIFDTWIDGWGIPENGSQVGYSTPPFTEQTIVNDGLQSMPFFYDNISGAAYSETSRTFDAPQDWIGDGAETLRLFFKGFPIAFIENPPGTYTISASGEDVWDESDELRYAYKMLSGDGSITARVVSVDNTNEWAKAGVMIRETLDAYSSHGFMFITPDGRRAFQNRATTGWESYSAHSEPNSISLPGWVKLERQSIFVTAYYSQDGINWIQQPTDENTGSDASTNPRIIVMRQDIYVGMAYTAHSSRATGVSVFSDVTITGTVTGDDWEISDIGVVMGDNDPESLYVAVEDSAGTTKVVEHPDNPDAVLATDWQQWDIQLSVFSDANVDLATVEKITIGVGNSTALQGGEGKLYFDDIKLHLPSPSEPNDPNAPLE
jgi:hypothetical protein